MSAPPDPSFDDLPPDPRDVAAERRARHGRILRELAELGMALARRVVEQAGEPASEGEASAALRDPGLAFSRIARAVRLTLALETRLVEEIETKSIAQREDADRAARLIHAGQTVNAFAARSDVEDAVEGLIEAEGEAEGGRLGEAEIENLLSDLSERLDDIDRETFIERPVSEIIAGICADLGLVPDWSRWTAEDWAVEEAKARTPGSPYGRRRRPASESAGRAVDYDENAYATGPPFE